MYVSVLCQALIATLGALVALIEEAIEMDEEMDQWWQHRSYILWRIYDLWWQQWKVMYV